MGFGVYIHFPYCTKRCPYCDFAVAIRRRIPHEAYARAVESELDARASLYPGRRLDSIYFGGGTPGLWEPASIARVVAAVRARFPSDREPEVTVEANPGDLGPGRAGELRAAGVNRLSLGVQSLAAHHLAMLGRTHGAAEARAAVAEARRAGFDNLSLDLMFALPEESLDELDRDLDGLLALAPDHLSIYNLTVEERTVFGALARAGRLALPDPDTQAEMFDRVRAALEGAGLCHYEISSFARPGRRAVHNRLYWSGGEWLGLGSAAHSFRRLDGEAGGERFSTVRSVDEYLARAAEARAGTLDGDPLVATREPLDGETLAREAMWLGLRMLDEGVDRAAYHARHGLDPALRFEGELGRLEREGLVVIEPADTASPSGRIRLSRRGALFADEVAARFL